MEQVRTDINTLQLGLAAIFQPTTDRHLGGRDEITDLDRVAEL